MLLLCALIAGSGSTWADTEVTFTPGTDTGETSVTKDDITATMTTMNNSSYYQIYANQSGTFSCSNGNITKIEFTCTASGTSKYGPGNASANAGSYSYSGNKGTWTGSAASITISSTAQIRMSSLTITYAPASTDPAISLSKTSLAFGEVEATGSKEMTFTVTPSNLTAGLTLSTDNDKYTVSPTSISKDATGAQTITVTASPLAIGDNMDGTVTISGDDFDEDKEVTLSATVVRKAAEIAYFPTSVTLTKGDAFTAPTFENPNSLAGIAFTSSYESVATVTSAGVIALGGSTGTTVIRATFAQNSVYAAGEATCTITVNPAGVTPEPSADSYYEKVTSTTDLEDGDYLIVYESGKVALDGSLASSSVDAVSNTIDVTFDNDVIEVSDATEAAEFEIASMTGGYSVKSKSNSYYLTHTGSKNTLNTSASAVANGISFSDGNATIKVGTYNIRYNSDSGQERFRYYTSAPNVQLYKKVAGSNPDDIDIYVSEAGMATYVSNFALDYSTNANLKAYIAVEDNGAIKYNEVEKVPAATGVLLRATDGGGKNYTVSVTDETTGDMTGNKLVRGEGAAVSSTAAGSKYNYILNVVDNEIGFYRAAGNTVATNRAYLQTSINAGGAGARIAIVFDDDDTTGVQELQNSRMDELESYYNLAGQRVAQPTKGLYIVNGKKVILK